MAFSAIVDILVAFAWGRVGRRAQVITLGGTTAMKVQSNSFKVVVLMKSTSI